MANVIKAIDFVLRLEDETMSGVTTHDAKDHGGRTRFGIAERFHPDLTATGFFDQMPVMAALDIAHQVYQKSYVTPLRLDVIWDQRLANAFLAFAVNAGVEHAIEKMQSALRGCGAQAKQDGIMGPATIGAINIAAPDALLAAFTNEQKRYYRQIAADDPSQNRFLDGWIHRADKTGTLAA